jgi:hypothetical protein
MRVDEPRDHKLLGCVDAPIDSALKAFADKDGLVIDIGARRADGRHGRRVVGDHRRLFCFEFKMPGANHP